jgi:hypothetical protein
MAKRRKAYRNRDERNNENHPRKTMSLLAGSRVAVASLLLPAWRLNGPELVRCFN